MLYVWMGLTKQKFDQSRKKTHINWKLIILQFNILTSSRFNPLSPLKNILFRTFSSNSHNCVRKIMNKQQKKMMTPYLGFASLFIFSRPRSFLYFIINLVCVSVCVCYTRPKFFKGEKSPISFTGLCYIYQNIVIIILNCSVLAWTGSFANI